MKFYPRAHEIPPNIDQKALRGARRAFFKAAGTNFLYLQVLFFGLFAYIFGALYQQTSHIHNLNILYVDYDNGLLGTNIRNAYANLRGDGFPSLVERSSSEFPTPDDLKREICDANYWAALFTSPGASDRLQTALTEASTNYDKADILSYVWNEARYPATIDSLVSGNLQALTSEARTLYAAGNWTDLVANATTTTFAIFADPWTPTSINLQPTIQGSRLVYNTMVIILILIQEFFYLGTINGLYEIFHIYTRLHPHRIIIVRNSVSLAYTFVGSLGTTGAIWAFRANWNVNGNQFVLTWMILWIFAHANFLTLDVFTVWLPPPFVPMALITWMMLNVNSILLPFELSPGFYKWAYAMPAHEVYQVLIDIWSGGCNPKLDVALPVLFAFEVSGLILSGIGVHRRAHFAAIKEEAERKALQARIDTAVAFVQQKEEDRLKEHAAAPMSGSNTEIRAADKTRDEEMDEKEREELSGVIQEEDDEMRRVQTQNSRTVNFGPAFGFSFASNPIP